MKILYANVGNIQKKGFEIHRPEGRGYYLFVLFRSPASVLVDGEYVRADVGDFILFDKHRIQSYRSVGDKEFVHDFMHFDTESDTEAELLADISKGRLFSLSLPRQISSILSEIESELTGTSGKYSTELLTHLGIVFLLRLKNDMENTALSGTNQSHYPELHKLRSEVYQNPGLHWTIDAMAQRACLSRSYFQYLYKCFFSVSCSEDIILARINHARFLLSTSSLGIGEIAEKCGYFGVEHFDRQFRKRTGQSPTEFRRALC